MKHKKENLIRLVVTLSFFAIVIFIFGCSTSPENVQGQIRITMVDAPASFDHINIVVTRVEVHKANADSSSGWVVINNVTTTYDLLTLRNGASAILGNTLLDAGHYTQIRLILGTGSNIVVNGTVFSLDVSSGAQTGIKLNHEFDIQQGLVYELTLDFNAEHSIVLTGNGQYKLNPVIRVAPMVISGTISGTINPVITKASVYAISGTDTVSTVADITTGTFKLMAVIQGTYTVKVVSGNALYNDKTIANVIVVAKQNTDLGTINLVLK
ncbi:MAG: DUF4382 domain-containing protein [Ignavibacteriales bacterium]|nr:DUF4382 domain-containing protein [Ignavibacteriales bacterium]